MLIDIGEKKINSTNFIYAKALQNYIQIFYLENDAIKSITKKHTMTAFKNNLKSQNIIQCHRSYFINLSFVSKISGTAKKPKFILTDLVEKMEIPISKKYENSIENWKTFHQLTG